MEKKDNRGGARPGAGRKPKAEEEKVKKLALSGLVKAFGSEEAAFEFMGKTAKEEKSFNHLRLLLEYTYGKPKETLDLNLDEQTGIAFLVKKDEGSTDKRSS